MLMPQHLLGGFLFSSFILAVLPLDFCGVAVTRKLASLAGDNVTLKKVAPIFIFDTVTKSVIFPILFTASILTFLILVAKFYANITFNVADIVFAESFGGLITQTLKINGGVFLILCLSPLCFYVLHGCGCILLDYMWSVSPFSCSMWINNLFGRSVL